MTAKWDKANKHRYASICVKYKKELKKDVATIEKFKNMEGETYLEKIENLLNVYDYFKDK